MTTENLKDLYMWKTALDTWLIHLSCITEPRCNKALYNGQYFKLFFIPVNYSKICGKEPPNNDTVILQTHWPFIMLRFHHATKKSPWIQNYLFTWWLYALKLCSKISRCHIVSIILLVIDIQRIALACYPCDETSWKWGRGSAMGLQSAAWIVSFWQWSQGTYDSLRSIISGLQLHSKVEITLIVNNLKQRKIKEMRRKQDWSSK